MGSDACVTALPTPPTAPEGQGEGPSAVDGMDVRSGNAGLKGGERAVATEIRLSRPAGAKPARPGSSQPAGSEPCAVGGDAGGDA